QIRQMRGDVPRELSPHWEGLKDTRRRLVRIVPWWMVALFTLVCLGVMYSGFAWVLSEQRSTVLQPYQSLDADSVESQLSSGMNWNEGFLRQARRLFPQDVGLEPVSGADRRAAGLVCRPAARSR